MKCPQCGAQNPDDAAFCELCLKRFGAEPATPLQMPPGAAEPAEAKGSANKKVWIAAGAVVVVVVLCGCLFLLGGGRRNPHPSAARVLFIGNSYTYVNDLPATFQKLARSLGNDVTAEFTAVPGFTLRQHSTYQDTLSKISSAKWDYVVLQEQSQMPLNNASVIATSMTPYAKQLSALARQANPSVKIVMFETWGRRDGDYAGNQALINATYQQVAADTGASVAPVGVAWSAVRQSDPDIDLYIGDGTHPSLQGTYLAACVFYDVVCADSSAGAKALDVPPLQAKVLQESADHAVKPAPATH